MKQFPTDQAQVIAEFSLWVKTQPSDVHYTYTDTTKCAFAQFLRANRYAYRPNCGSDTWNELGASKQQFAIPLEIDEAVRAARTFGKLNDYFNG